MTYEDFIKQNWSKADREIIEACKGAIESHPAEDEYWQVVAILTNPRRGVKISRRKGEEMQAEEVGIPKERYEVKH